MKKDLSELNALLTEVDERRLMSDVDAICTGERLSNAAEKASFEFLAKAFAKAGCEVTMEWLPGYVSTPEKAALRVNGEAFPCLTHPMTPSAAVEGRLRYVAAGHDAEANDLADSIVLTEGLAMEPRVRAFEARGARGVIFITGRFTHNMIVSRVWGSPTPETRHDYVGIPVASTSLSTGNSLKTLAKENACACLATEVHSRWTTIPALTATLPGVSDDFVMVTGHNDSWGLGALDNASGNACELELARLMASVPREKRLLTIRFVIWGGHSHGRYAGSTAYLDAHFMELAQHGLLNINTDCLGGRGATVLTQSPAMACTADLARFALRAPPLTPSRFSSAAARAAALAGGGTRRKTPPTSSIHRTFNATCASFWPRSGSLSRQRPGPWISSQKPGKSKRRSSAGRKRPARRLTSRRLCKPARPRKRLWHGSSHPKISPHDFQTTESGAL